MSVPDEGYFKSASCALNLISTFLLQNGPCRFKRSDVGATDMGFTDIQRESEMDLKTAVATVGPISVAIDAGHKSFQLYRSGTYQMLYIL